MQRILAVLEASPAITAAMEAEAAEAGPQPTSSLQAISELGMVRDVLLGRLQLQDCNWSSDDAIAGGPPEIVDAPRGGVAQILEEDGDIL